MGFFLVTSEEKGTLAVEHLVMILSIYEFAHEKNI